MEVAEQRPDMLGADIHQAEGEGEDRNRGEVRGPNITGYRLQFLILRFDATLLIKLSQNNCVRLLGGMAEVRAREGKIQAEPGSCCRGRK